MTAAPPRAFLDTRYAPVQDGMGCDQKSQHKVLAQRFCPGIGADPAEIDRFRAWFRRAFARWLQANFHTHEQVAASFGVRGQTALNWWNAANRPSGDTAALVFMHFPAAVAWFLAEWERDA